MLLANTGGRGIVNTTIVKHLIDTNDRIGRMAAYARAGLFLSSCGDGLNAYAALIDGSPVISVNLAMSELFDMDRDAYAGIVSHLYAHLKLRHGGAPKARSIEQLATDTFSAASNSVGIPGDNRPRRAASIAMKTIYSAKKGAEADRAAAQYLAKAGFGPTALTCAWSRLVSVARQRVVQFFDMHPATELQMARLRELSQQCK